MWGGIPIRFKGHAFFPSQKSGLPPLNLALGSVKLLPHSVGVFVSCVDMIVRGSMINSDRLRSVTKEDKETRMKSLPRSGFKPWLGFTVFHR
jgi:hypothetical protein